MWMHLRGNSSASFVGLCGTDNIAFSTRGGYSAILRIRNSVSVLSLGNLILWEWGHLSSSTVEHRSICAFPPETL